MLQCKNKKAPLLVKKKKKCTQLSFIILLNQYLLIKININLLNLAPNFSSHLINVSQIFNLRKIIIGSLKITHSGCVLAPASHFRQTSAGFI